ncbi:Arc family DNA-binding protein, partial [Acinetobacter baumannii]
MEDTYRSQFRLPYALYELLKAAADANKRSVNAELVSRLE